MFVHWVKPDIRRTPAAIPLLTSSDKRSRHFFSRVTRPHSSQPRWELILAEGIIALKIAAAVPEESAWTIMVCRGFPNPI
jgi:hypothetical protein